MNFLKIKDHIKTDKTHFDYRSIALLLIYQFFSPAGFTQYLLEDDCHIFDCEHGEVCQDMTHPLSHYFIASSHNT